ncbi:MAG: GTPase obg [Microgenomates group bacterium GW2011_GWA2_44_7]|nr:MAG: GTPase obg [Microgenomates group bacterium GW2011_GWA2_44_7]
MLVDETKFTLVAGHGGAGSVSFGKMSVVGADGGNGGVGGDVYIRVTSDLKALGRYPQDNTLTAADGEKGSSKRMSGKNGKDLEIIVPIGTTITNILTGEEVEFNELDQRVVICKGGKGGWGNYMFKSSVNTSPTKAEAGLAGESKTFKVVLKLIAQYGLIGLPNAGKSSILNQLTNADAGVGDYPFTTLEANLGVHDGKIIADIPGLIEGASTGKGLGIKFLKHIEKVGMLLHCIAANSTTIMADYQTVNSELEKFDPKLLKKRRIILLTKTDLVTAEVLKKQIKELTGLGFPICPISIYDWDSFVKLEKAL